MSKRYIQSAWLTGLLIIWGCLVTGCSEQSDTDMVQGERLQICTVTRGSSYVLPEGIMIQISPLLQDGEVAQGGFVTYAGNNTWNSGVYVELGKEYFIYGYMPSELVSGSTIAAVKSGSNVTGANLSLNGVSALSDKPLCVVIGVAEGAVETVEGGNFAYESLIGEDNQLKGISLLMDYLCAGAQFQIKIDPSYNELRTVKLKKMVLTSTGQYQYGKSNLTITFTNGQTNPISSTTATVDQTSSPIELTIFEDKNDENDEKGVELKEDESIMDETRYFLPSYASHLLLVSTYDVYDKKGNKIRENCEATNSMSDVLKNIERGQIRPVTLTVTPTYLYVLSEPDLENPTVKIN